MKREKEQGQERIRAEHLNGLEKRDVEVEGGSGSGSTKILLLSLPHIGGKGIGSAVLRRRANRGSINIKK